MTNLKERERETKEKKKIIVKFIQLFGEVMSSRRGREDGSSEVVKVFWANVATRLEGKGETSHHWLVGWSVRHKRGKTRQHGKVRNQREPFVDYISGKIIAGFIFWVYHRISFPSLN